MQTEWLPTIHGVHDGHCHAVMLPPRSAQAAPLATAVGKTRMRATSIALKQLPLRQKPYSAYYAVHGDPRRELHQCLWHWGQVQPALHVQAPSLPAQAHWLTPGAHVSQPYLVRRACAPPLHAAQKQVSLGRGRQGQAKSTHGVPCKRHYVLFIWVMRFWFPLANSRRTASSVHLGCLRRRE